MKLSIGGVLVPVPRRLVGYLTSREANRWARRRGKLTPMQRRLHGIVVRDLPGSEGPLTAAAVASASGESEADVQAALNNLHTWLGFIALDDDGSVVWAYPVTVANTPHHLAFESGERMTAA